MESMDNQNISDQKIQNQEITDEEVSFEKQIEEKEHFLIEKMKRLKEMEQKIKKEEKAQKEREQKKKQVLLRIAPSLWNDLASWAEEDFRSINGQIEYLLAESVKKHKKK